MLFRSLPWPGSLGLGVKRKAGDDLPWNYPGDIGQSAFWAAVLAGTAACELRPPNGDPTDWGWHDSYYEGHPGYMTWIAGKTNRLELAGLGALPWLNGGRPAPEVQYSFMDQSNLPMYAGDKPVISPENGLRIPAFVALASSQVEGTPVVAHGKANAKGKLITVHLPFSQDSPGDTLFIFH